VILRADALAAPKVASLTRPGGRAVATAALLAFLSVHCGSGGNAGPTPTPTPTASASPPATGYPAGVYSLQPFDVDTEDNALDNPNVAGIALRTRWASIEGRKGRYDWRYLDSEIQKAKARSKRVSIYVSAEPVPDWVFGDGAQDFAGGAGKLPIPWDPLFLDRWTGFIAAFGARYANESTIAYTRGSTDSLTSGWGLPSTDGDGKSWLQYGYTTEKMLDSLTTVVDAFLRAFPRTHHWAAIGNIPFEPTVTGKAANYVSIQIANYGFNTYPDRFGVWRENLSGCVPYPPMINNDQWITPYQHPGANGAQMLWNVQDGPSRMNQCGISPNDKATVLRAAVNRGIDFAMPYLEVYRADVTDPSLQDVMAFAASRLRTN
jgi:hypothetical protein